MLEINSSAVCVVVIITACMPALRPLLWVNLQTPHNLPDRRPTPCYPQKHLRIGFAFDHLRRINDGTKQGPQVQVFQHELHVFVRRSRADAHADACLLCTF